VVMTFQRRREESLWAALGGRQWSTAHRPFLGWGGERIPVPRRWTGLNPQKPKEQLITAMKTYPRRGPLAFVDALLPSKGNPLLVGARARSLNQELPTLIADGRRWLHGLSFCARALDRDQRRPKTNFKPRKDDRSLGEPAFDELLAANFVGAGQGSGPTWRVNARRSPLRRSPVLRVD